MVKRFSLPDGLKVVSNDLLRSQISFCDPSITAYRLIESTPVQVEVEFSTQTCTPEVEAKILKILKRCSGKNQILKPEKKWVYKADIEYTKSLNEELEKRKLVNKLSDGVFLLGSELALLLSKFDSKFEQISLEFGAKPAHCPTLVNVKFLNRIGFFKKFPHYGTISCHLPPEMGFIENYSSTLASDSEIKNIRLNENFIAPSLLSPTICYHVYNGLQDQVIEKLPHIITAKGKCFRWEGLEMNSLQRLWEFTMRECVTLGLSDQVMETRNNILEKTSDFAKSLGLVSWVESANDLFFTDDSAIQSQFQQSFSSKLEIHLQLDSKGHSISTGSFNFMQNTFGKLCNIVGSEKNEPLFSSCVGWGLERWVYALIAQRGLNPKNWEF